jgi:hypothetical protein
MRPLGLPISTRVILLYLTFTYFIPGVLISSLNDWPDFYNRAPHNWYAITLSLVSIAVSLSIVGRRGMAYRYTPFVPPMRWISAPAQTCLLFLFSLIVIITFIRHGNDWRYSDVGLSEANSFGLYVFALMPAVLKAFVFAYLMLDYKFGNKIGDVWRKILLIISLALTINGNMTAIITFLFVVSLLFINSARTMLWVTRAPSERRASWWPLLVSGSVLTAGFVLGWLFGETVKQGRSMVEVFFWFIDRDLFGWLVETLVGRISSSYVSTLIALDQVAFSIDYAFSSANLLAPLNSFIFRLSQFLPSDMFSVEKPEYGSLMRINYISITPLPLNDREGTSPGLIASFLLAFPFPLNFIIMSMYLLFIAWVIDGLCVVIPGRVTSIGAFAVLIFVLPLFESPIDLLLIIDDSTIYVLILIAFRFYCCRAAARARLERAAPP